ncbi:MAG: sensor histidine kinase [Acidimicrobiales bacterium]
MAGGANGAGPSTPGWGGGLPDTVRLPTPVWRTIKWFAATGYAVVLLSSTDHQLHIRSAGWGAPAIATIALEAAALFALLWRATRPEATVIFETGVLVAWDVVSGPGTNLQLTLLALATYSLVVRRPPRHALAMVAAAWAVVSGAALLAGGALVTPLAPNLVFLVAAVASALFIGSQRALLAAAQERAEQAERERNYHAVRAVAEERVRIARELHDVVAHHVSLLVVQAGAVRETLPPGHQSREVLDSMIEGGRQAMAELRAMLGALREAGIENGSLPPSPGARTKGAAAAAAALARAGAIGEAPRAPQPTLEDVGALVEGAGLAGLPVTLELSGQSTGLPPAVALAAYRVTQEALTNVVKHAPGAETVVAIDCASDGVSVRVRNGRPLVPVAAVAGHQGQGLMGMAERAAHCHGWVKAGPEGEGFAVEAWLPVAAP